MANKDYEIPDFEYPIDDGEDEKNEPKATHK